MAPMALRRRGTAAVALAAAAALALTARGGKEAKEPQENGR